MTKLKWVRMRGVEQTDPEFRMALTKMCDDICKALDPLLKRNDSNLTLNALNWVMAGLIMKMISDDKFEKRKAVSVIADSLIENVEFLMERFPGDPEN